MSAETPNTDVLDRVNSLRRKLAGLSTVETLVEEHRITTGCEELDQLLPGKSLRPGMLIELLMSGQGCGAGSIAIECARRMLTETDGCLVVTDRWRRFYPPAAVARGIETKDLIVVRSSDDKIMSSAEELWALDQSLRCPGVGAVVAWLDKVDPLAFRRLQLAAETGQTLALFMRPARVQTLPTWSDVQLLVQPQEAGQSQNANLQARQGAANSATASSSRQVSENRFCQVTLLRQRGRAGSNTLEGTSVDLEINENGQLSLQPPKPPQPLSSEGVRHAARTMHMAPRVAHPANRRRQTGA